MTLIRRAALLWATLLPLTAGVAWAQRAIPCGPVRGGTLSFDGHATTGDFTGSTTTVTGEITAGGGLLQVRGWVEAPVMTLKTGNNKRDKDLNKSMESDQYPTIRFELSGVTVDQEASDSASVKLEGSFIIHGVRREATLPATVVFGPEGIRVRAQTPLNLKDYSIGGLTKMLGLLKMHEEIVVRVDLTFGPAAQAASGS
jgi:polyisoprenoid-binding protein YceI